MKTSAWSCDMEGHARKCVERQGFQSLFGLSPNQKKKKNWKIQVDCQMFVPIL